MSELSPQISAIARNNESMILRRISQVGQKNVAEAMGMHPSTVTRMKDNNGFISQVALFLSILELDPHQKDSVVIPRDKYFGLLEMAKIGFENLMREKESLINEMARSDT